MSSLRTSSFNEGCKRSISKNKLEDLQHRASLQSIKAHDFVLTSYKRPTNCNGCNCILLGIVRQGYRCSRCDVNSHEKCLGLFGGCGSGKLVCTDPNDHIIKTHSYKQPTFCNICDKMLLGVVCQGKRCQICKGNFHSQCLKTLRRASSSGLLTLKRVFGEEIFSTCLTEQTYIPNAITLCIKDIEERKNGLQEMGLYRVSGTHSTILALKDKFDLGVVDEFVFDEEKDIHNVACLLKLYLRELPTPLFTFELFDQFEEAIGFSDREEKITCLSKIMMKMPVENRYTAMFLLTHLKRLSQFADVNKMSTLNISVCFGPTVFKKENEDAASQYSNAGQDILNHIINEWPLPGLSIDDDDYENGGEFSLDEWYDLVKETAGQTKAAGETSRKGSMSFGSRLSLANNDTVVI